MITLLLLIAILAFAIISPVVSPPITFTNQTATTLNYQYSEVFNTYLEEWQIVNTNPSLNPFSKERKYLVKRLEIVIVANPPTNPIHQVISNTTPPRVSSSIQPTIIENTLSLHIYQNEVESTRDNEYQNKIMWLTLYTLYKLRNPQFPENDIPAAIQPYFDSLTKDESHSFLITYD